MADSTATAARATAKARIGCWGGRFTGRGLAGQSLLRTCQSPNDWPGPVSAPQAVASFRRIASRALAGFDLGGLLFDKPDDVLDHVLIPDMMIGDARQIDH